MAVDVGIEACMCDGITVVFHWTMGQLPCLRNAFFSKKFALNGNSMVMIVLLTHGALRSLVERLALNEVSGNFYLSSATNQINCHSERSIAVSFRNTCSQL